MAELDVQRNLESYIALSFLLGGGLTIVVHVPYLGQARVVQGQLSSRTRKSSKFYGLEDDFDLL